jgi:hypothetical protein
VTTLKRRRGLLVGATALLAVFAAIVLISSTSCACRHAAKVSRPTPRGHVASKSLSPPTIVGYATPNSELYASFGSWTTGGSGSYDYQWLECDSTGTRCANAVGPASGRCSPRAACYVVTGREERLGNTIRVVVTPQGAAPGTGASSTPVGPVSMTKPVSCALTHAAGYDGTASCWAQHTGVEGATGYSEAQIEHGAPIFRHVHGKITISQSGTVIDHEWISGCVAIDAGANDVSIRDSLITPPDGDYCSSSAGGSQASALNDGNSSSSPTGLLVEDTTVDGGNATGNQYGASIVHASCVRCNVFGFAKNLWSGTNSASAPTVFQDVYSHDNSTRSYTGSTPPLSNCAHDNGIYISSSSYVTVEHSYVTLTGAGYCVTAAINGQADHGPPSHDTIENSYLEGIYGTDLLWGCGSTYSSVAHNAFSSNNGYSGTDYVGSFETQATNPAALGNTWVGNYVAESPSEAAPPPTGDPGTDGC